MNLRFVAVMIVIWCITMMTSPVRVNVHARVDMVVPLGVVLVGSLAVVVVRVRIAIVVVSIVGSMARWKIPIFDGTVICVNSMMDMMNITMGKMMTIAELMSIAKSMVADAKTIIICMVVAMGSMHDMVSLCTVAHHVVEALPVVAAPAISMMRMRSDEVIRVWQTLGIAVDPLDFGVLGLFALIVHPGTSLLLLEHFFVKEVAANLVRGSMVILDEAVVGILFKHLGLSAGHNSSKGERLVHD